MVGFVLIVTLVVIGIMVFMVLSLNSPSDERDSVQIERLLSSLMEHTTECAIVFEPQYDSVRDLIKSCYNNEKCSNLDAMACDYLEEVLEDMTTDIVKSEASVSAYTLIMSISDGESYKEMLRLDWGNCTGSLAGAQKMIAVDSEKIIVRLSFCY